MRFATVVLPAIVAATLLSVTPKMVSAGTVFSTLAGTWTGTGTVRQTDGKQEKLRCTAYYTKKGANGLGLAIRCASAASQLNMRGSLNGGGTAVSGTWEERTFNASGSITGTQSASALRLSIRGTVAGSISISVKGNSKSVTMSTANAGSVSMRFSRN